MTNVTIFSFQTHEGMTKMMQVTMDYEHF